MFWPTVYVINDVSLPSWKELTNCHMSTQEQIVNVWEFLAQRNIAYPPIFPEENRSPTSQHPFEEFWSKYRS